MSVNRMSQNRPKTHCVLNELIDKTQNDKVRMIPLFQKLEYLYATILPKPKATMCEKWRNKKDPNTGILSSFTGKRKYNPIYDKGILYRTVYMGLYFLFPVHTPNCVMDYSL